MRQLLLEGPGKWRRANGDTVAIVEMSYPHLNAALNLVNDRLENAKRLLHHAKLRHEATDESVAWRLTEEEANDSFAQFDRLIRALTDKQAELSEEIRRRPSPLTE